MLFTVIVLLLIENIDVEYLIYQTRIIYHNSLQIFIGQVIIGFITMLSADSRVATIPNIKYVIPTA